MIDDVTVVVTTFSGREAVCNRAIQAAVGQAKVLVRHDGKEPKEHSYDAWREGVYEAETKYVCILHDDDWYLPTFVERCRELIEFNSFVATEGLVFLDDGRPFVNVGFAEGMQPFEALLDLDMALTPSCCMYRREAILDNLLPSVPGFKRGSVVCGPDAILPMLTCIKDGDFYFIAEPLVCLDGRHGSTTVEALAKEETALDMERTYLAARDFCKAVKQCWQS